MVDDKMIKKRKDLEIGDVYVDKQNKKLSIYVGCVLGTTLYALYSTTARYYSYVVTNNYRTYVKKKSVLHFLEKNHNYAVEVCNLTTSNYTVNVLYNIKEELQNYEIKKGLCGYEVANCMNTKGNIKRALDSEKSRLHYYRQLDLTHKLFRRG